MVSEKNAPIASESRQLDELSLLLKASGDSLRLEILSVLSKDSFGVLELCNLFNTKQSGMSHHLKVLANAGLVSTRREGNSIYYRRDLPIGMFSTLKHAIFNSADHIPRKAHVEQQLTTVYAQRAEASRAFFVENANRFKEQQDLIAAFDVYGEQVTDMLKRSKKTTQQYALELGPGAGELLPVLSQLFTHVIALDNSQAMLNQAQALATGHGLKNIEWQLNDSQFCTQLTTQHINNLNNTRNTTNGVLLDCVVINMVLHHTPSPAQVFADVCSAIKPGGILIITDLCAHDQDWARTACGDHWLGFEPHDLNRWGQENRMNEGESIYVALRNGFQIQIRQFIKKLNYV